ncbi:FMN-binding negative transcriptional regulator [Cupriavidus plantarum]|uniref:PaiB family negative transcriptional regulator n=1 Tax=Cupriavidus plantarum TaxID=942865 RepID=A0A316EUN2_9BURK|nr:FMN-binding negative transcriptional regulator [Cupriavidus plantarum]PWK34868.1 PaiB family negative transcriptional regulator [Cupriavidus plantarum]
MYTPPAYAERDAGALHAFMRAHSFASLITFGGARVNVTHLPFLLDTSREPVLYTHMARANAQLADLRAGAEALVVFQGPHAFVSPSWYENRHTFPTWNYTAVHARGVPTVLDEPEAVLDLLERTVARYDMPLRPAGGAWTLEGMPAEVTRQRMGAIAGVRIPIATLEGKMKLNQDKSVADRAGVIAALEALGEPQGVAVAALMRDHADMQTQYHEAVSDTGSRP